MGKYRTWAEMSDAEKGELLLAFHNGRTIEVLAEISGNWMEVTAPMWNASSIYRALPGPKRETVTLYGGGKREMVWCMEQRGTDLDTHRITFDLIDGEPDCASIKMVRTGPAST